MPDLKLSVLTEADSDPESAASKSGQHPQMEQKEGAEKSDCEVDSSQSLPAPASTAPEGCRKRSNSDLRNGHEDLGEVGDPKKKRNSSEDRGVCLDMGDLAKHFEQVSTCPYLFLTGP